MIIIESIVNASIGLVGAIIGSIIAGVCSYKAGKIGAKITIDYSKEHYKSLNDEKVFYNQRILLFMLEHAVDYLKRFYNFGK